MISPWWLIAAFINLQPTYEGLKLRSESTPEGVFMEFAAYLRGIETALHQLPH